MPSVLCAGPYTLRAIFAPLRPAMGPNRHSKGLDPWTHQAGRPLYLPLLPRARFGFPLARAGGPPGASDRGNAEAVANKAQRTCAEARSEGRMSLCKDGIPTA
jgi:hypothetical protein